VDTEQFRASFQALDNKTVLRQRAPFLAANAHLAAVGGAHGGVVNTSGNELFDLFLVVSGSNVAYRSSGVCLPLLSPLLSLLLFLIMFF
jgi:hypothetical protein